jgi:hypothetical protein
MSTRSFKPLFAALEMSPRAEEVDRFAEEAIQPMRYETMVPASTEAV